MVYFFNTPRLVLIFSALCLLMGSCKYEELAKADYPQQVLYMPAAKNGLFTITTLPTPGAYKFSVNLADKKLIIPLSVFRGGVSADGDLPVTVAANADTISKLITGKTLVGTIALPTDKFELPGSVTIENGKTSAPFDLRIDLDYLRANPGLKLAIGVGIASTQATVNPLLKTTIITLDPAILKPVPTFTTKTDATLPRKITFTNTSLNATGYSWDFGDGSVALTDAAPVYTYTKAGTFTVTLTATGITGSTDAVKKTATLVIP